MDTQRGPLSALWRGLSALTNPDHLHTDSWAIAWSGGADSTALLHLALRHRATLKDPPHRPLLALHIDHGVHDESANTAQWCRRQASIIGASKLTLRSLKLPAGTLNKLREGPARHARYRALGELMRSHKRTLLLTAHHADDNLETLLLALLRGSGLTGLAGVRPLISLDAITGRHQDANCHVARPMLETSRDDLRQWLLDEQLTWREDPTNHSLEHRRNAIRHQIIPSLVTLADGPAPLRRAANVLHRDRRLLEDITQRHLRDVQLRHLPTGYEGGLALDRKTLITLEPTLGQHILRAALMATNKRPPPSLEAIDDLWDAVTRDVQGTRQIPWASHTPITTLTDAVLIGARLASPPAPLTVLADDETTWGRWRVRTQTVSNQEAASLSLAHDENVEMFDAEAIVAPLQIRSPRRGERITRWGGGTKRVSRLLITQGVHRAARPWTPVITDAQGQLLWVVGVTRSAAAPRVQNTRRVLIVETTPVIDDE